MTPIVGIIVTAEGVKEVLLLQGDGDRLRTAALYAALGPALDGVTAVIRAVMDAGSKERDANAEPSTGVAASAAQA